MSYDLKLIIHRTVLHNIPLQQTTQLVSNNRRTLWSCERENITIVPGSAAPWNSQLSVNENPEGFFGLLKTQNLELL